MKILDIYSQEDKLTMNFYIYIFGVMFKTSISYQDITENKYPLWFNPVFWLNGKLNN